MGVAAAFIAPAVAAITLGIVGYKKLEHRIGRNEMFNHGGNVTAALTSGLIAYYIGLQGVFVFTFFLAVASIFSLRLIDKKEIDHDLARGKITMTEPETTTAKKAFLNNPLFIIFTICAVLFHFANAAMLPLAGQYIAAENNVNASVYMSACIIIAQLVMVPVAAVCGKRATMKKTIDAYLFFSFANKRLAIYLQFQPLLHHIHSNIRWFGCGNFWCGGYSHYRRYYKRNRSL